MYKVIKLFADLQDNNHVYRIGDVFPRSGVEATEERLAELASCNNKQGVPLIEKVDVAKAPSKRVKKAPKE
jgi:hypothetical protein